MNNYLYRSSENNVFRLLFKPFSKNTQFLNLEFLSVLVEFPEYLLKNKNLEEAGIAADLVVHFGGG